MIGENKGLSLEETGIDQKKEKEFEPIIDKDILELRELQKLNQIDKKALFHSCKVDILSNRYPDLYKPNRADYIEKGDNEVMEMIRKRAEKIKEIKERRDNELRELTGPLPEDYSIGENHKEYNKKLVEKTRMILEQRDSLSKEEKEERWQRVKKLENLWTDEELEKDIKRREKNADGHFYDELKKDSKKGGSLL